MAGYSTTPLAKKLGLKAGYRVKLINVPDHYFELFSSMPEGVTIVDDEGSKKEFIHFFTKEAKELVATLPKLKQEILPDGVIWISWPKRSANISCDVSENLIRETALKNGLVDIKVCAVDEIWSGLKLVIPLKDRETSR